MAEICDLHARLIANLRLGMSVFLQRRPQERAGAARAEGAVPRPRARVRRLAPRRASPATRCESIETSSLHLDLISDLKRINSHICSIAYPILEEAGVLARTRLKDAGRRRRADDDPCQPTPRDATRMAEAQAARPPDA